MDKIFQLTLETRFDDDKRFQSFPHISKDGAKKHRQKLLEKYLSFTECKVVENPNDEKYDEIFAEDENDNYIFLKIEEVKILD